MNFRVQCSERYGDTVSEHSEMDALRKRHCLCLNCTHLSNKDAKCARHIGYAMARTFNVAFAMTRCKDFVMAAGCAAEE